MITPWPRAAGVRSKTELLPRGACFTDLEEARLELAEYLDHYDNIQRLHAALSYGTPLEMELHYLSNLPWLPVRFYPTTSKIFRGGTLRCACGDADTGQVDEAGKVLPFCWRSPYAFRLGVVHLFPNTLQVSDT